MTSDALLQTFLYELLLGILYTLPIYLVVYFTSSSKLFSSTLGSITEWRKISCRYSMIINRTNADMNKCKSCIRIKEVTLKPTSSQIKNISKFIDLIDNAEKTLILYKTKEKFISFGILLSIVIALMHAFPTLNGSPPNITKPGTFITIFTAINILLFTSIFNWRISNDWNQFKEDNELNLQFIKNNDFK